MAELMRFTERLVSSDFRYAFGLSAADLTGSGSLDLVSTDADRGLYWFENDGSGNFTRHVVHERTNELLERHAVADINGDGKPEIVVVDNLNGCLLWFGFDGDPRDPQSWRHHYITEGGIPGAYDVDIVATVTVGGEVVWYENPGDPRSGPWKKHVIDTAPRPVHGHPVDMDGDGDVDLVMALGFSLPKDADPTGSHQIVWYENDGSPDQGPWRKHVIAESFPNAFEAVPADLDGDGQTEVVATAWGEDGRVAVFKHRGDPRGPWDIQLLKEDWTSANVVIVADLDGDGRPDIAACAERGSNELRWWKNEGPVKG